ncbi:MAG: hypothetical protein EYC70_08940 [Planctomycetota bacterium]|nr:MAG: hypothetical protein EYC70_08940 [Planctomycetota bacterium]
MKAATSIAPASQPAARPAAWIQGSSWDFTWLIGSALIVPVVLLFVWGGASSVLINLGTTAVVGGPHLFATFLASYGDPRFRRSHRPLLWLAALGMPALVVWGTLANFQVLLSVFIFTASLHVLHQNAYLTDVYRRKAGLPEPRWARFVDYALLMLCIYPIASYKLVHSNFYLGDIEILIPRFLKVPATYWAVWIAFSALLGLWLWKTANEWRQGVLNRPKTLLIATTTCIAFFVPASADGARLELAFQAVNAWHSVQYLGVVWFILKERRERGELQGSFVQRLAGAGRATLWFYTFCFAVTSSLLLVLFALSWWNPVGLSFDQYYYMGVLSCLLIHYVLDGYFFAVGNLRATAAERVPYALPALRSAAAARPA